jgi:hypothetical protein
MLRYQNEVITSKRYIKVKKKHVTEYQGPARHIYLNSFIGNPKLGLMHSRCAALIVQCGIGMTAIGVAKCVPT